MSEFRQDIVSQHWVLFAPNRANRPEDFKHAPATPDARLIPDHDKSCPFCPGREEMNMEVAAYPKSRNWKVRVILNKFEALGHTGGRARSDFYTVREGIGDHEVVITSPHNVLTAFLPDDLMDLNLQVYQERMIALSNHPEVEYVHILQNHGREGGASLLHPHSQIFATPFVPEHLHDEVTGSYVYFQSHGACIYCEMIFKEMADKERIVLDHKDFLVFAPFAARVPYALRIIPKRHQASFTEMTRAERRSLAQVLKLILQKLHAKLNNPAYNYYIHSLPVSHSLLTRYDDRSYHWHLEILPRLNVWGGFELGSDVYVNTVLPEMAADVLRQR
ncbi:MAG: galactose-1-phosphate uridylyltransferase [Candidatus Doudnabacteria bacterium]|nr:galactose-1-phosphate uridylyltransferase [Candidatus Doudnabacteria bacterium]